MADATVYLFSYRELLTALVKQQGLHEGLWTLVTNFTVSVSNIGPDVDSQLKPGVITVIESLGLRAADPNEPNLTLSVDASEVNPS